MAIFFQPSDDWHLKLLRKMCILYLDTNVARVEVIPRYKQNCFSNKRDCSGSLCEASTLSRYNHKHRSAIPGPLVHAICHSHFL